MGFTTPTEGMVTGMEAGPGSHLQQTHQVSSHFPTSLHSQEGA